MHNTKIPSEVLVEVGIEAMYQALTGAKILMSNDRENALSQVATTKEDNITLEIDRMAEATARMTLFKLITKQFTYKNALKVWGEESINERPSLDLSTETHTIALLDMIDGTDLVNRGLGNWCSAMAFFYPPDKQILAAIVGLSNEEIYYARAGQSPRRALLRSKGFRHRTQGDDPEVGVPSKVPDLEYASICFYGQKAKNLLSLFGPLLPGRSKVDKYGLADFLLSIEAKKPPFRIYNLGGNPMMIKVAEGKIHAVFELLGQKPHDVVPGAFIAKMAGAVVKDLKGNDLPLEAALMRPNEGSLTYIVAASRDLYEQLRAKLADAREQLPASQ